MQMFPREITDYVGDQFCAFFGRRMRHAMTLWEAQMLIDHAAGPAPAMGTGRAADLTRPRVDGGGRTRPSGEDIEAILHKYAGGQFEDNDWDGVFTELIRSYQAERDAKALRVIRLTFERNKKREAICEQMHISTRTFHNYRLAVLSRACLLAVSRGLVKVQ
jgi:hypothetical protein